MTPKIGSKEVVYENRFQQVYRVHVDFEGHGRDYFVTDYQHRAGVVVVRNGMVLLVRQYRLLIDRISLEIPGGRVNVNETPAEAAVRECIEETGVCCHELKPLLVFQPGLDSLHNPTHLFFSEECEEVGERFIHPDEVTDTCWISLSECKAMIFTGEIVDSLSIISLLAYMTKSGP